MTELLSTNPFDAVGDMSLTLEVGGQDRVDVQITNRDPLTGQMLFTVAGRQRTPTNQPTGDTTILAKLNGHTCATAQVIVVVPDRIHFPFPQANGNVQPQNLVLNSMTTPPWYGLPPGHVILITAWLHTLTITVEDQFGETLYEVYAGQHVFEEFNETWFDIHQVLTSDGTYPDPVGITRSKAVVPANDPAAQSWPTDPPLAMPTDPGKQTKTIEQRIPVRIDGHGIGKIIRDVIGTPPNHVQIKWPP